MIDDSRRAHQSEEDDPVVRFEPWWVVSAGRECEVGVVFDDHCLVFLVKDWADQWTPTSHIPVAALKRVASFIS